MKVSVDYEGSDRLAIHIRDHEIVCGRPVEGDGTDAGPTPTELFVASLAACVAEYAALFLTRHGLHREDLLVECTFSMSADRPPRVDDIEIAVVVPDELDAAMHAGLQRVVDHCAVHNSLRQPPAVHIRQIVGQPA